MKKMCQRMINNIIANFSSKLWSLISVVIFIPYYIKFLGFESYAIISFSLVIYGVITVLDSGLTSTLSRELARIDMNLSKKMRTFDSLQTIYFLIAILVVLFLLVFSTQIGQFFIKSESFSLEKTSLFIRLFAVDIGLQMLFRFQLGGLLGLEKQVLANVILSLWILFRNGLVILVIYYSNNLESFFIWQSIVTFCFTVYAIFILNSKFKGSFSLSLIIDRIELRRVYKFAFGMLLISIVAILNSQLDKLRTTFDLEF